MRFSIAFATVACLVGAAMIKATPVPFEHESVEARDEESHLEARHTQAECEAACTLAGLHGAAWGQCVSSCVAGNYPTPPPSPQNKAKGKTTKAKKARELVERYTQAECEAACTLAGLHGAAWDQCVRSCVAGNYPTPPPSPQNKAKGKTSKTAKAKKTRELVERYTQAECEAACTLAGLHGAAWDQCVRSCVAGNYPTPPPSPQNKAKGKTAKTAKAKKTRELVERYTQAECEAACTLAGLHGAAWDQCVRSCVAGNYPTPPPSPQNKAKGKTSKTAKVKKTREIEDEVEELEM